MKHQRKALWINLAKSLIGGLSALEHGRVGQEQDIDGRDRPGLGRSLVPECVRPTAQEGTSHAPIKTSCVGFVVVGFMFGSLLRIVGVSKIDYFSKAKIRFQSSFILTTVQPSFFAWT